jgi:molybdenum cofactor guanylyltransferase
VSVSAAIIAGGRARRFGGRVKALIEVDGLRIIDRQLLVLRQIAAEVAIIADHAEPFAEFGLPVLADAVAGQGPLGGLAAALAWSPSPRLFAVACDMPFLRRDVIEYVLAHDGQIVVPVAAGRPQPLHAVYRRSCAALVTARLTDGRRALTGLLDEPGAQLLDEVELRRIDRELRCFANVNSESDLKNLGARVS